MPRFSGGGGGGGGDGAGALHVLDNGAISAQVPDSTATGGNDRGLNAIDLQVMRNAATEVASGSRSKVGGGEANSASGTWGTVGGGAINDASGQGGTVAGGYGNVASGFYSSAIGGRENVASDTGAFAAGYKSEARGAGSVALGESNLASGPNSSVVGGLHASAPLWGQAAYAAGRFTVVGDAQHSLLVARRETADATTVALMLRGSTEIPVLPAEKVWAFKGMVVAKEPATGDASLWEISGGIKRLGNVTTLIGTPTITELAADLNAGAWDVGITADDVNDSLAINVTGEAAKTIRWVATIDLVEVA